MKILVTGSSGYVGSSFMEAFKNQYQFVNFSLQKGEIEHIDFTGVDTILHAAALVHQSEEHPYEKYQQINVTYPLSLAKRAKAQGVKQFVFISTIAVYGESLSYIDEQSACTPSTPYGISKYRAEQALQKLQDENFIVSIIRPPMIYGDQAPGNIQTLVKIINQTPLLPFGGIHNRRSFIYIHNLTAIIDRVIQLQKEGLFLVSDDHAISTSYLIETLASALNKKLYLFYLPFFAPLLKKLRPKVYSRLYNDLEINNQQSLKILKFKTPYSVENAIISAFS